MSNTKKLQVFGSLVGPQGPKGDPGEPGLTPVKGEDYFTEADKVEMTERVLEEMPEIDVEVLTETTYAELKVLRDNSELKTGRFYRITDYETTTVQENTQSAGHPFDILVRAVSESELEGKVSAIQHSGDEYFVNSDLAVWELWYSLDNDTSRFAWADASGKGVIYRMIDEFGNECPYDFKNITMLDANNSADSTYYYTFDANGVDHSLDGSQCFGNVINKNVVGAQQINNIVFINCAEVSSNFFDYQCYNNTFYRAQRGNKFGRECYENVFEGYNYLNTFDTKFRKNFVGSESQSMQFGQGATSNIIGANTYYCRFGNYFRYNTTCQYMYYSEFGHYVQNIILGESAETTDKYMRFLTFENNVQYVNLYKTDKTTKTYMENVRIASGTVGTSANRLMIPIEELAQKYTIKVAMNSDGDLLTYCEEDVQGSSSGSDLPSVTEQDNDKFLKVIDGEWAAAELPVYDGEFSVTPSATEDQTLLTAQKLMDADVKIEKIPYAEVTNTSNGTTVTIA